MADHGTIKSAAATLPKVITAYVPTITGIPTGTARTAFPPESVRLAQYRIAGTELGEEPIDRVQWFPRGDWQNDGE